MRICLKEDCRNPSIPRGKFCEMHRTNKRRVSPTPLIDQERIVEDRLLRDEQKEEYDRTVIEDERRMREIQEEKELELAIEMSRKMEIDDKRKNILDEPSSDYFNIQFFFPSGRRVRRKFSDNSLLSDVRNFVDIYLIDNEIKIQNYNLVYNFPCRKFTYSDGEYTLNSIFTEKSFSLYIENLDS
jgi:hypothetical protein